MYTPTSSYGCSSNPLRHASRAPFASRGDGSAALVPESEESKGLKSPGRTAVTGTTGSDGALASGWLVSNALNALTPDVTFGAALSVFVDPKGLNALKAGAAAVAGAGFSAFVSDAAAGLNAPGRAVDETVAAPLGAAAGFLGSSGLNGLGIAGAFEAASFLGPPMFAK